MVLGSDFNENALKITNFLSLLIISKTLKA